MRSKIIFALVLAAPFVVFLVLLALSPPDAGSFLGATLSRIVDPYNAFGIVIAALFGTTGLRWSWAAGLGLVLGVTASLIGYSFSVKVGGSALAIQSAWNYVIWSVCLALYGFTGGRMVHAFSTSA